MLLEIELLIYFIHFLQELILINIRVKEEFESYLALAFFLENSCDHVF